MPHLMLQPRSRRSQQGRRRKRILLVVLGAALASGVYLMY
jgi:hypothetical protein